MTVHPTLLPGAPLHPPTAPEKLRRVSLNEESCTKQGELRYQDLPVLLN